MLPSLIDKLGAPSSKKNGAGNTRTANPSATADRPPATRAPQGPRYSRPPQRPLQHSTTIPPQWPSQRDASITLRGLKPKTTASDIYQSFERYGNIVSINIFDDVQGRPRYAHVRFKPAPSDTSFFRQGECIIHGNPSYFAWIEFNKKAEDGGGFTPRRRDGCPTTIDLDYVSLKFGVQIQRDSIMVKKEVFSKPNYKANGTSHIDFEKRKFILYFEPEITLPGSTPLGLGQMRADIKFSNIKQLYRIDNAGERSALVITVTDPPVYWKIRNPIATGFRPDCLSWEANDLWQRAIEVRGLDAPPGPASLEEVKEIDFGRWTTYWIDLDTATASMLPNIEQLLRDWNITIKTQTFHLVPSKEAEIWRLLKGSQDTQPTELNVSSFWAQQMAWLEENTTSQLAFDVRYQLEVCLSHGVLIEYTITSEFLKKLVELSQPPVCQSNRARLILEYAADRGKTIWNPMGLFDNETAMNYLPETSTRLPSHCILMRKVVVTPTKIYFNTPTAEMTNRVTRKYRTLTDNFIRVQFTDERLEGRVKGCASDRDDAIYQRAYRVLDKGIKMGDVHWEFLAFGNSQIRENGAFFFRQSSDGPGTVTCDSIRKWMGKFSHITVIAKYAARLGQCLSTTRPLPPTIPLHKIVRIPDVENGKFCFTDGVGKISSTLMLLIAEAWNITFPPSAIQFRMGGCKGVLVAWPNVKGTEVRIRKSQEKFSAEYNGLEIVRCSHFASATLNRQTITILSCLGVPNEVFLDLMREQLDDFDQALTNPNKAVQLLMRYIDENTVSLTIKEMILNGFMDSREPFIDTLLHLWVAWSVKTLKEKARLVVEKGAFVLGGVDETGALRGHSKAMEGRKNVPQDKLPQIFLQIPDERSEGGYRVITGLCIVGRNPSLHPGDIRVVEAVDVPALNHVVNVVLFPLNGDRDVPSMCSGGDLDGDDFFVIWDQRLIPPERSHAPMDFTPLPPVEEEKGPTSDSLKMFFVLYMKNNTLPLIAYAHLAMADFAGAGAKHETCIDLAHLHSKAVDYAKTGIPAEWDGSMEPPRWPHFMNQMRKSYHSRTALGQLYDMVKPKAFDVNEGYKLPFDKRILNRYRLSNDILKKARHIKSQYDISVRRVMKQLEIATEFELWTGFVMSKPRIGTTYKVQERVMQESSAIKHQFRIMCTDEVGGSTIEELGPFVAAMYQVTWEEVRIALHESRHDHIRQDGTQGKRSISARSMPFISFPWLFEDILGEVAGGLTALTKATKSRTVRDVKDKTKAEAKDETESSHDDELEKCWDLSVDGHVIHRGQILHLFGDDDSDDETSSVDGNVVEDPVAVVDPIALGQNPEEVGDLIDLDPVVPEATLAIAVGDENEPVAGSPALRPMPAAGAVAKESEPVEASLVSPPGLIWTPQAREVDVEVDGEPEHEDVEEVEIVPLETAIERYLRKFR
ncbi:hypothetical protein OQA88_7249 [Cercophora sp. LCS_1]